MKLNKFFWSFAAIAALGLASCSSDNVSPDEPNAPVLPGFNEDGEGYLAVNISLPATSSSGSRADATGSDNDVFDDGTPDEYAVKSALLILFTGTKDDGSDAKFDRFYNLAGFTVNNNTSTNITETITKIVKVKGNVTTSDNFYALALINWDGTTSIESDGTNELKIKGTALTSSSTYEDVAMALLPHPTSDMHQQRGFLMTNAPIVNADGTAPGNAYADANTVTTLVNVKNSIKQTEQEAKNNAATINVERVIAKVDLLASTPTTTGLKITSATYAYGSGLTTADIANSKISAAITGWQIANVAPQSYLVRQWQSDTQKAELNWLNLRSTASPTTTAVTNHGYRFAGYTAGPYRTYWCYDPQYDADATLEASGSTTHPIPALIEGAENMAKPQYIFENTFNLAHQNIKNTTCAIFKVTFSIDGFDGGFYTVGDDHSILYNTENIKNYIADVAHKNFNEKILELAKSIGTDADAITFKDADITVAADKKVSVNKITFTKASTDIDLVQANSGYNTADWNTYFNGLNIYQYTGGVAYYYIPIKHFGDDLTPWINSYAEGTDSYKISGAWNNNNWLGRYGIVRNNWYRLEVAAINGIGSATVPDLHNNSDWDDQVYSYLALKINVLSWAQRKQSVTLQ